MEGVGVDFQLASNRFTTKTFFDWVLPRPLSKGRGSGVSVLLLVGAE